MRLAVLKQMQREKVPASLEAMGQWLKEESDPGRVAALLDFLRDQPAADVQQYLEPVIRNPLQSSTNRLTALALFVEESTRNMPAHSLRWRRDWKMGRSWPKRCARSASIPSSWPRRCLTSKLDSVKPEVRAAAIETLGELRAAEGGSRSRGCSRIRIPQVRRAAAGAAGKLRSGGRSSRC